MRGALSKQLLLSDVNFHIGYNSFVVSGGLSAIKTESMKLRILLQLSVKGLQIVPVHILITKT